MGVNKNDIRKLKDLKDKFEKLEKKGKNELFNYLSRQIALRFLQYVIPDTPVQQNQTIDTGFKVYKVKGGALRRGWIGQNTEGSSPSAADIKEYAESLPVKKAGTKNTVTITNNVEYAPYVEYGHRQKPGRYVPILGKRLVESWVPGQFMLKRATKNIESVAPALLRRLTNTWFKNNF